MGNTELGAAQRMFGAWRSGRVLELAAPAATREGAKSDRFSYTRFGVPRLRSSKICAHQIFETESEVMAANFSVLVGPGLPRVISSSNVVRIFACSNMKRLGAWK